METIAVDNHQIRWYSNQCWKWQPHLHFFENNLSEHLRKCDKIAHRRRTREEVEKNKQVYRNLLLAGNEVTVNKCTFKLEK